MYEAPQVEVIEVDVEKGYQVSGQYESLNNGGTWIPNN